MKENDHSTNILLLLSNFNERTIFEQIPGFFVNISSKNQYEFRKDYKKQKYLLAMLDN